LVTAIASHRVLDLASVPEHAEVERSVHEQNT
jgi:hypothetical protein